jgi:hypothetical protein
VCEDIISKSNHAKTWYVNENVALQILNLVHDNQNACKARYKCNFIFIYVSMSGLFKIWDVSMSGVCMQDRASLYKNVPQLFVYNCISTNHNR